MVAAAEPTQSRQHCVRSAICSCCQGRGRQRSAQAVYVKAEHKAVEFKWRDHTMGLSAVVGDFNSSGTQTLVLL